MYFCYWQYFKALSHILALLEAMMLFMWYGFLPKHKKYKKGSPTGLQLALNLVSSGKEGLLWWENLTEMV